MMPPLTTARSLTDFLDQPDIETSPAWEFIAGQAVQKPMPALFHSRLQRNLVNFINARTEQYEAMQELRCLVPPHSPVPDIAVVASARLPETDGPFVGAPDWLIEIRSPDQGTLSLQTTILHCLNQGTQLAWLIDLTQQQIWVWQGDDLPRIAADSDRLPNLDLGLDLTVAAVMAMTQRA